MRALVNTSTNQIIATAVGFNEGRIKALTGVQTGVQTGQIPGTNFAILTVEYLPAAAPSLPYQTQGQEPPAYADGKVTAQMIVIDLPLEQAKTQARREVETIRDVRLAEGFGYDFGAPHGVKVMQTRPADLTNWLGVASAAQNAVIASQPDAPVSIRVEDNTTIALTAATILPVLAALQQYHGTIHGACWAIKDAIDATTTVADLRAIDLTAGWPASTLPPAP